MTTSPYTLTGAEFPPPLQTLPREDVRDVILWLETVTRLGPQAAQVLNLAEATRWLATMLGVPDELVTEDEPGAAAVTALANALAQQRTAPHGRA
jgi:hypothetical protein